MHRRGVVEVVAIDINPLDLHCFQLAREQPFANHNGGHLVFGPDGLLHVGLGDGGSRGAYSFDDPARGGTTALIIGDINQTRGKRWTTNRRIGAANNYGWREREGEHAYDTTLSSASLPLIDPIYEYNRAAS